MSELMIHPHLDKEGLEFFKHSLTQASHYLEYGSGGSTVLASNYKIKSIITIENDPLWNDKVAASVKNNYNIFISLNYCDIGPIKEWGFPKSDQDFRNYWKYITLPWTIARKNKIQSDLIMIDGRFRVACFLYSLLQSAKGTKILFDDYTNRKHYRVVEEFCKPIEFHGRMAYFNNDIYNEKELLECLLKYSTICD